jgi:hypothetical protein
MDKIYSFHPAKRQEYILYNDVQEVKASPYNCTIIPQIRGGYHTDQLGSVDISSFLCLLICCRNPSGAPKDGALNPFFICCLGDLGKQDIVMHEEWVAMSI